jgi:methionyl-tRNA formyltransferase
MNRTKNRLRLLVLGTRKLGFCGLKTLVEQGFNVVGVITYDYEITEGYTSKEFAAYCEQHNIQFFTAERIHSGPVYEAIRNMNIDLGISLYWRRLIKKPLIDLAPAGFINAHAADLPKYRGFAATSWAIFLGEASCGLCIHRVVPGIADNGEIFRFRRIGIDENTTIKDLMEKVTTNAIELTLDVVREQEKIWPKIIEGKGQDESQTVLAYPRLPCDGEIDWYRSAEEIHRHVRSVTKPYPGAYTWWNGEKIYIWRTRLVPEWPAFVGVPGHIVKYQKGASVWVLTGRGVIEVQKIEMADQKNLPPGDLIQSVQTRFGMNYSREIESVKDRLESLEKVLT